jgi:hypothetical protein
MKATRPEGQRIVTVEFDIAVGELPDVDRDQARHIERDDQQAKFDRVQRRTAHSLRIHALPDAR